MNCDFCGDILEGDEKICPSCGRPVKSAIIKEAREVNRPQENRKGIPKLIVILALLFMTPIGLILMPFSDFSRKVKTIFFIVIGAWIILSVFLMFILSANVMV
ncbi:hypothetical protein EZV73_18660 [Acidaminobacter sp. JC074]|uniref:hypothetical protein n=1 Tax=Acidaminobacter sp. JC074 TaxID=2530199 RepID=UPI001F0D9759|nr:hypothetical protein [Acidaminobacter sp. JC074]MCH4889611.1 hypothetical protein [Acidaminobacter sp. JC074]